MDSFPTVFYSPVTYRPSVSYLQHIIRFFYVYICPRLTLCDSLISFTCWYKNTLFRWYVLFPAPEVLPDVFLISSSASLCMMGRVVGGWSPGDGGMLKVEEGNERNASGNFFPPSSQLFEEWYLEDKPVSRRFSDTSSSTFRCWCFPASGRRTTFQTAGEFQRSRRLIWARTDTKVSVSCSLCLGKNTGGNVSVSLHFLNRLQLSVQSCGLIHSLPPGD